MKPPYLRYEDLKLSEEYELNAFELEKLKEITAGMGVNKELTHEQYLLTCRFLSNLKFKEDMEKFLEKYRIKKNTKRRLLEDTVNTLVLKDGSEIPLNEKENKRVAAISANKPYTKGAQKYPELLKQIIKRELNKVENKICKQL